MSHPKPIFACRMCGTCCHGSGGIVVNEAELRRLAEFVGVSPDRFATEYTLAAGAKRCLTTGEDAFCVFYVRNEGCAVHPARPDVCRAWPYFRGNLIDATSLDMAKADCPGIAPDAEFEAFRAEGRAYLRGHGLTRPKSPLEPSALWEEDT